MKRLICICITLVLSISVAASFPKWTVIFYMMSAPDLEESIIDNMLEISETGSNENVNIVAQIDWVKKEPSAAKKKYFSKPYDTGAVRYYIQRNKKFTVMNRLGEVNMGDGRQLIDCLDYFSGMGSDSFIIVLAGHGSGYESWDLAERNEKCLLYDDNVHDSLSAKEVADAMEFLRQKIGTTPRFLVFDSCLMQNLEMLTELQGKAFYTAGSEASIIIDSADYNRIVRNISKDPKTGLNIVAEDVTSAFCLDWTSSTHGGVFSCFSNWGGSNMGRYLDRLASSLLKVEKKIIFKDLSGFGNNKRYFDLGEICHCIINGEVSFKHDPAYSECKDQAKDLLSTIKGSRAALRKTGLFYWRDLEGISVWLPKKEDYEFYKGLYKKGKLAQTTLWDEFLDYHLLGYSKKDILEQKEKDLACLKKEYLRKGLDKESVHEKLEIIERIQLEVNILNKLLRN